MSKIELADNDGAIIFREGGAIELSLPDKPDNESLPDHLYPMLALVSKLRDKNFVQHEIEEILAKEKKAD